MCDAYEPDRQGVPGGYGGVVRGRVLCGGVADAGGDRVKGKKRAVLQLPTATAPSPIAGRTITVMHPVYGAYTAEDVKDKLQAVQRAAKVWGGLQWSKIARECDFREVDTSSTASGPLPLKGKAKRSVRGFDLDGIE